MHGEKDWEAMNGMIEENSANAEKFYRLRKRNYLTKDNRVNIMVVRGAQEEFAAKIPPLDESLKKSFA